MLGQLRLSAALRVASAARVALHCAPPSPLLCVSRRHLQAGRRPRDITALGYLLGAMNIGYHAGGGAAAQAGADRGAVHPGPAALPGTRPGRRRGSRLVRWSGQAAGADRLRFWLGLWNSRADGRVVPPN